MTDIDLVINLKLREEALLAKCLGRRMCSQCGGNYNVACIDIKGENGLPGMYMAPLLPPSSCESKLITRSDDTEEVVKKRFHVYNEMVDFIYLECVLVASCFHVLNKLIYEVFIKFSVYECLSLCVSLPLSLTPSYTNTSGAHLVFTTTIKNGALNLITRAGLDAA